MDCSTIYMYMYVCIYVCSYVCFRGCKIGRWFFGCPAYQSGPGKDDVSMASQSSFSRSLPAASRSGNKLRCSAFISTSTSRKKRSRRRWLRCHRNVDPETVLPRTELIRGTPEKPYIYTRIGIQFILYIFLKQWCRDSHLQYYEYYELWRNMMSSRMVSITPNGNVIYSPATSHVPLTDVNGRPSR